MNGYGVLLRASRHTALLLTLAWAAVIYYLSDQPGLDMPALFPLQDKLAHLLAYAILGALGMASRPLQEQARQRTELYRVALLAGAYGVLDELHQYFVPGRHSDPLDALTDCVGAWLGAAMVLWLARRIMTDRAPQRG
jgi:VanZ family protein